MTLHALPDVGADPRRLIVLDAVHNFRDMGGYPTDDGRTTRWRTLFRADGLYRLAGADLEVVRELGLRTVIDLRSDAELQERGTFPHAQHPVAFHHVPVIDSTWQHLDRPDADDPVLERVVECRFFAGLDVTETAAVLARSPRSVERDWARARAYLYQLLSPP